MSKKHRKLKNNGPNKAETSDIHTLYELSVQNVEFEVEFVADTFKKARGRDARFLREDFCGTAGAACEWVKQHDDNSAVGVDLDASVLEWGRNRHVQKLKPEQEARISLLNQNVLDVKTDQADVLLAMNFSYWCFKQRNLLKEYFSKVHASLKEDGMFFMDAFGGHEAYEVIEEETEHEGFTYIWDQAYFNPVTSDIRCHIHFKFPDGSKIQKAFTYEWRLWTLPEIRELLEEVGFKNVTIYMQGWDDELDEETDEFFPVTEADADPGWVAYITAEK